MTSARSVASALVACSLAMACLLAAPRADAARPLAIGVADDTFKVQDSSLRQHWFNNAVTARTELVRINVEWRNHVSRAPESPADPGDPAYDFSVIDGAVREATSRGLQVMLTVYDAPDFAEGADRPADVHEGSWKPDPVALGAFAQAVATRYSGGFDPDGVGTQAPLPQVHYLQAWNEPNLIEYLNPQWDGRQPRSPELYRELLNAFTAGARAGNPGVQVVSAGTGPYGQDPGVGRMRPLLFWRELTCLEGRKDLKPRPCPVKADFDIASHHPINNTPKGPTDGARHPDDASTPEYEDFAKIVHAAEKAGTLAGESHPLWATEFWWESEPPDGFAGVPLKTQARYIAETFYSLWRQGADAAFLYQLVDAPFDPKNPYDTFQSGVYFQDGRAKPSLKAVQFPFVGDAKGGNRALAWGKSPTAGEVAIQRREGKDWKTVERVDVTAGEVFATKVGAEKKEKLRAVVPGFTSLSSKVG